MRLEALTSLRCFAAILVVAHHYRPLGLGNTPDAALNVVHNGTQAVTLFFILSGFVLGYNHFQSGHSTTVDKRSFWAARFARIYPLYALALAASLPFFLYGHFVAERHSAGQFFGSLVLVPALLQSWIPATALAWNPPAWSLSVEAFFYFLFPSITALFPRQCTRTALFLTLVIAATAEFVRVSCYEATEAESAARHFASYFPLFHLPKFVLGIALARFYLRSTPKPKAIIATPLTWISLAAAIALLSLNMPQHAGIISACLITTFSALIYSAACIRQRGLHNLNSPLLILLGEASYGIYILHLPLGMWFTSLMKNLGVVEWHQSLVFSFMYLALVLAISVISYRWIETPLRHALRRRLQITHLQSPT